MKTLQERLRHARISKGMSQAELGKAIDKSQSAIAALESGRNKESTNIVSLAKVLDVDPLWLETGEGGAPAPKANPFEGGLFSRGRANVEPAPEIKPAIPIISWVAAGCFTTMPEQHYPSTEDKDSWVYTTRNHSPKSFGLKVRGESMSNPGSKHSFQEGEIVLVDPEMNAANGDFVIVRLDDEAEATFKKLIIEGNNYYLTALNPDWPEKIIQINGNATIIGVVFEKVVRFK